MTTENITAQRSKLQNIFWDFYNVLFFTTLLKNINFLLISSSLSRKQMTESCIVPAIRAGT